MMKRYFSIAGITICLEADLEWEKIKLNPALLPFVVDGPGQDNFVLQRFFEMPDLSTFNLGSEIYHQPPWAVYQNNTNGHIYYKGILPDNSSTPLWTFADFPLDYTYGKIFNYPSNRDYCNNFYLHNLSGFPSDTIWIAQLMANRCGAIFHSSAATVNGMGLLFIGRSEAGKSTTFRMLQRVRDKHGYPVTLLCDETNIVRRLENGWQVCGTWGHGEESEVSAATAPLKGIFVLKQAASNAITPISDRSLALQYVLLTLFRPFMTGAWWEKALEVVDLLVQEIPIYEMSFDKSGKIIQVLDEFTEQL